MVQWFRKIQVIPEPVVGESFANNASSNRTPESNSFPQPTVSAPQKGHVLKITADGGVFCQKCGKSTKLLKHQRLKIPNKPCRNADLPQHLWVDKPGCMNNMRPTLGNYFEVGVGSNFLKKK